MVAVSMRNCAHIIKTDASILVSSDRSRAVKAKATALTKEPMATKHSAFLFCIILHQSDKELIKN